LDYYEGGALDEITLRENTGAWEKLKLTIMFWPEWANAI